MARERAALRVGILLCAALALPPLWQGLRDGGGLSPAGPVALHVEPLVVDANLCPTARLRVLPGVGPVLAARLDAARRRLPFRGPEDLRRVRGIGPAAVRALAPHLRFGPGGRD